MSALDELREEAAKADEVKEVVEEVVEEVIDDPVPTEEPEEVDEIELTIDDEPKPTYSAEQSLVYKLTKEKKKRKEADSELERLKAENEALKAGKPAPKETLAGQYGYPPVPVMYADGIENAEQYRMAWAKWTQQTKEIDLQNSRKARAKAAESEQAEQQAARLAGRAAQFIKANRIKEDMATSVIQAGIQGLDEALGIDGIALDQLDIIGEGSEKVAYYLGKNPDAIAKAKKLFEEDTRGFKLNTWLTNTARKLDSKKQHISNAPAPDEPLEGDGSSASAALLQKQYDKATDYNELVALRKKAKSMGVTLT